MTQNKKPKWDGKSRITTPLYRKRFNEIFKKEEKKNEPARETPKPT
tara:strand:- start:124 stop:261 length:138 start_codon:yes stop_codon:yes gene_type:complete